MRTTSNRQKALISGRAKALAIWTGMAGAALLTAPSVATAFSEDVCPARQGGWQSCIQQACSPGGENLFCQSATLLSQYATIATGDNTGVRSVLHFDSVYLLAQAAGLSPWNAYQVASYDQAVDTGKFDLRDENGQLVIDRASCGDNTQADRRCLLNSADISGVGRNNFVGGGLFFHFHTVPAATQKTDGLNPDVQDSRAEPFLNHLRTWAYGKGPLCLGGLAANGQSTAHIDSGPACYQSSTRPVTQLLGRIPFLSQLGEWGQLDWISTVTEQGVVKNAQTGEVSKASALEKNLPAGVPVEMVRMGIYLHAMQDRISHHRCIQASSLEGPRPADAPPIFTNALVKSAYDLLIYRKPADTVNNALSYPLTTNPEFFFHFSRNDCDQLSHFQRHSFEVGTSQKTLDARDRTTEAGLQKSLSELLLFVREFKPASPRVPTGKRAQFMADLVAAIEEPDAALRIQKISAVAPLYGLLPLPGHQGLSVEDWISQADQTRRVNTAEAGGAVQSGASNQTPSTGGGGSMQMSGILILLGLCAWLRKGLPMSSWRHNPNS